MPVRDARPLIGRLSLDKEGFVLLQHQTAAKNLYDEDEITSVYYPACERVIKEATGAARVVAFDHIVRNAAMAALEGSCVRIPAKRIHVHLPTTNGRELVLTRYTEPEPELSLLLEEAETGAARPTTTQNHRYRAGATHPVVVPTFGDLSQQSQTLRSLKVLELAKLG